MPCNPTLSTSVTLFLKMFLKIFLKKFLLAKGARIASRYHAECFSGFADPRSQASGSHHVGPLAGSQFIAAPSAKAGGKMRTTTHFDSGGNRRSSRRAADGGLSAGKLAGGIGAGHNSFAKGNSSKGEVPRVRAPAPGGFTMAMLAEHDAQQAKMQKEQQPVAEHGD
eukprot:SAG31_NODE_1292_length_8967_cov_2.998985_8_plen_167_part_00